MGQSAHLASTRVERMSLFAVDVSRGVTQSVQNVGTTSPETACCAVSSTKGHLARARFPWCPIRAQASENEAIELRGEALTMSGEMAERSHLPPLRRTCRHWPENRMEVQVVASSMRRAGAQLLPELLPICPDLS